MFFIFPKDLILKIIWYRSAIFGILQYTATYIWKKKILFKSMKKINNTHQLFISHYPMWASSEFSTCWNQDARKSLLYQIGFTCKLIGTC